MARRRPALGASGCAHCGAPLPKGSDAAYCCAGCEAVSEILRGQGLERYYDLRPADGRPARPALERDHKWIEPIAAQIQAGDGLTRIQLDAQGIHCAACVWLIDRLFERQPGAHHCVVNPARGRLALTVGPSFPLEVFAQEVEAVGYRLGPASRGTDRGRDELTLRLGISAALAVNAMMLSCALYFGLADGPLYDLARQLVFGLSTATVAVGGSWFIRSAWRSLRQRALHLDLPIALGIVLAFGGSVWSFLQHDPRGEFFDTVAVFVAVMLLGRWLQERMVAANRAQLLAAEGTEALYTRRISGGHPELVRCDAVEEGDLLLLGRGDLVPVDARLEAEASLRLDWINGESEPLAFQRGALAPAGSFLASAAAVRARATGSFSQSPLTDLLAAPVSATHRSAFWDRLGRFYVLGVLLLAGGACLVWAHDPSSAIRVTTAVLVVTCPCAFGIAVPLAYELVHAASARRGLFVREGSLLERARHVRHVVFDKTGTLTVGLPALVDVRPLEALGSRERSILYTLTSSSTHPKAQAIAEALHGSPLRDDVIAHEAIGQGMQALVEGTLYRLGRPGWAAPASRRTQDAPTEDVIFAAAGRTLAAVATQETLRPDAADEIRALETAGYECWILSGDSTERVQRLAARLGIPSARAFGDCPPAAKARWLRERHAEQDTLFVGDGINDALAAEVALVSGTPSIDRPFMPARCDFWFITPGLAPIRRLLLDAQRLRKVVFADLSFAVVYNLGAVGLAYAGLVEPWLAAVLMPVSSIATIALTAIALREEFSWTR